MKSLVLPSVPLMIVSSDVLMSIYSVVMVMDWRHKTWLLVVAVPAAMGGYYLGPAVWQATGSVLAYAAVMILFGVAVGLGLGLTGLKLIDRWDEERDNRYWLSKLNEQVKRQRHYDNEDIDLEGNDGE